VAVISFTKGSSIYKLTPEGGGDSEARHPHSKYKIIFWSSFRITGIITITNLFENGPKKRQLIYGWPHSILQLLLYMFFIMRIILFVNFDFFKTLSSRNVILVIIMKRKSR